ncbi:MAG: hypothetical protein GY953_38210 [bacterium]|nr:hypothetical protein [bacterium]
MPKSIIVEPGKVLAKDNIHFSDIPVNAYDKPVAEELSTYSRDDLLCIFRDMCIIREFENTLNQIKLTGAHRGVTYAHRGPAHLSIGQEAAAVGMAYLLGPEDHIYGSHRSHGEILAKGMSAIRRMEDNRLLEVMRTYLDGAILKPIEPAHSGSPAGHNPRGFNSLFGPIGEIGRGASAFGCSAGFQLPQWLDASA